MLTRASLDKAAEDLRAAFALTRRESDVVALAARGKSNAEIGAALFLAPGTVKKHLARIYAKLGVSTRAQAVALAFRAANGGAERRRILAGLLLTGDPGAAFGVRPIERDWNQATSKRTRIRIAATVAFALVALGSAGCGGGEEVTPTITTVIGSEAGFSGDGGPARAAELSSPSAVAAGPKGILYIADTGNNRVRRVDEHGVIATVAGNGNYGSDGDGGPAKAARLIPLAVDLDAEGNIYVADRHSIRKVDYAGTITSIAGRDEGGFSGDGGPATAALLEEPAGLALDGKGDLYISDANRVRKVDRSGVITTVAGTGTAGFSGDGGPASSAQLNEPEGLAVDTDGNLYVAEFSGNRVRKVDPAGIITTVAGTGTAGFSGDGGPAASAQINGPSGLAVDGAGNLYICEHHGGRVRRVDGDGVITTVVGTGEAGFAGDGGPATEAELFSPLGMDFDESGALYIADRDNHRIRKVTF